MEFDRQFRVERRLYVRVSRVEKTKPESVLLLINLFLILINKYVTCRRRPFGLIHIDYENKTLDRSMKNSSQFWIEMAATRSVPVWEPEPEPEPEPQPDTPKPVTDTSTQATPSTTPSSAAATCSTVLLLLLTLAVPVVPALALSH